MKKSNKERELGSSKKNGEVNQKHSSTGTVATKHEGEGQKRDHGSIL